MTEKQNKIMQAAHANGGQITTRQAVETVGHNYHNSDKYTGETLSRMVKAGHLIRVRPGVYRVPVGTKGEQSKLF